MVNALWKKGLAHAKLLKKLAGTTGLEPATSCVTGMRSNQLNYVPADKPWVPGSKRYVVGSQRILPESPTHRPPCACLSLVGGIRLERMTSCL